MPSLTYAEANKVIHDRWLDSGVGWPSFFTSPAEPLPSAFDNEIIEEPATVANGYVRFVVEETDGKQRTMGKRGSRKYQRNGRIAITLLLPPDIGKANGLDLVGKARSVFEGVSFGGVRAYTGVPSAIGNEGRWWKAYAEIAFSYDEVK